MASASAGELTLAAAATTSATEHPVLSVSDASLVVLVQLALLQRSMFVATAVTMSTALPGRRMILPYVWLVLSVPGCSNMAVTPLSGASTTCVANTAVISLPARMPSEGAAVAAVTARTVSAVCTELLVPAAVTHELVRHVTDTLREFACSMGG